MSNEIRNRLLERARTLHRTAPGHVTGLEYTARDGAKLVNDLDHFPHAYVIGCVMDRQIKAERAWKIPERVQTRLGSFAFDRLAELSQEDVIRIFREPEALHRFPDTMAKHFHSAVRRIEDEYDGDASAIWSDSIGSATLVRRLLRFDGVGPKIATMAANILVRDFGIELADRHYIDISVDSHVKRVFQRLDLVPKNASNFEVTFAAREMNSDYPGIFDLAVWEIGRKWCHPGKPNCPECYMIAVCPGASRFHPDVSEGG